MGYIKNIILIASVLSILITILYNISPESGHKSQFKFILTMFFIIGAASPVINGKADFKLNSAISADSCITQEEAEQIYEKRIIYYASDNIEKNLSELFEENNIESKKIKVVLSKDDENSINVEKIVITECNNFNKAKNIINNYFSRQMVIENEPA